MRINHADCAWVRLLRELREYGHETHPRGQLTRELVAHRYEPIPMTRPVVTVPARNLGYRFMCAEAAWLLSGDDRVETIAPFSRRIGEFSDDGVTFFGAYGPRIRAQLDYVLRKLREDPDSRQAVINIWRESPPDSRDVPCTLSAQFLVRTGALHLVVTMRSSDAWLGVPYDVFNFSMLGAYVAIELGLTLGNLINIAGSRHLYDRDAERARECEDAAPMIPPLDLDVTEFQGGDSLTDHLWRLARRQETRHRWLTDLPALRWHAA